MFLNILNEILSHIFFLGSYSNEVFPDPLPIDKEQEYIKEMQITLILVIQIITNISQ